MTVVYKILTLLKHLRKCFWRILQERQKGDIDWPQTPEELLSRKDPGSLPEIYNATFFPIDKSASINQYGYATTTHIKAL